MNHPFIRRISKAYYNDLELYKYEIWENQDAAVQEISDEIIGLMNNVKLEDVNLYWQLHKELDQVEQQRLTYAMITNYLNEQYNLFAYFNEDDLEKYNTQYEALMENQVCLEGLGLVGFGLGAIASIITIIAGYKQISRAGWKILAGLNAANKALSQYIDQMTKSGKVKRSVLINNVEMCYRKCNVQPNEVSALAGMALSNDVISTPKARQQAECLAYCYFEWTLGQVDAIARSYVACLHASGERGAEINDLLAILRQPTAKICQDYHKILSRHYNEYKDAIEVIFREDPGRQDQWMTKYRSVLNDALRTGKINKPEFNNPSFRTNRTDKPFFNKDKSS